MIPKENRLIITFHTTADAMEMEKRCRSEQVPGRLIPVPRAISAGCGLSWSAPPADRDRIISAMQKWKLEYEGEFEVII